MQPFTYAQPDRIEEATALASANQADSPPMAATQFIAGGTNMADYMRLNINRPERLIDVNKLDDPRLRRIEHSAEGLYLGALVRMAEAAEHDELKARYPVIAESLKLAASAQIRNMASLGGNLLQRTRCEYFRETSWPCNKRNPGSGCAALAGVNRHHAVLGGSDQCIAVYGGDFAQALIALDAAVDVQGPQGKRRIAVSGLHRLPGHAPHVETVLTPQDIVTGIHVPPGSWQRSRYVKVRDRESYAFALAAAAVALDLEGGRVRDARIALGGVATVPWRAREAEHSLIGVALDETSARAAARIAFAGAVPHRHNAFKIPLGQQTLVRALLEARDMEV